MIETILLISSILLIIVSIGNIILTIRNRKLKEKLSSIEYWIFSVDNDDVAKFSAHDARYVSEIRKILVD